MAHVMDAAADRIAPWRRADWRIDVGEGLVLILAGVYLLADGQRAEFILGKYAGLLLTLVVNTAIMTAGFYLTAVLSASSAPRMPARQVLTPSTRMSNSRPTSLPQ